MNPHTHFLFPFAVALILNKLGVVSWKLALVCGIVGVVVDADHYVEHLLNAKTQRFSFIRAWNDAVKFHHFDERSSVHHLKGFLVLSLIFLTVSYFDWRIALILGIGYYSHLLLDYANFRRERFLRWHVGRFLMKESYMETVLDIALVLIVVIIIMV